MTVGGQRHHFNRSMRTGFVLTRSEFQSLRDMPKLNWKSLLLLVPVTIVGAVILVGGIFSTVRLSVFTWSGLAPFVVLIGITLLSSRFTVPFTNVDGSSQSHKSVADAFIFLAVMMYTMPPANTLGPAIVLAAIVGFISSLSDKGRWNTIFAVGMSVISTFVASQVYRAMLLVIAGSPVAVSERGFVLDILLFPLCVFGLVQYALSTFGTLTFNSFSSGKRVTVSHESLIWTLITQVANVTSAALFYSTIRAKDQTTHGHVRRTQIYATEMGKLLKVSELERRALVAGALLHDIGKLAVPEYILNKPGKLTEAEFAKMKIHPTVGGDILKRVNFPYPVEDIVRYHHEKWDGSGYPKGLKAEAIPLVARIISVVDFYDATRCDRPYRKGMKREESLALLRSMVGSAFDPRVVETFTKHVEEFDRMIDSQDIRDRKSTRLNSSH